MKRFVLAALLLASCSKEGPPDLQISDAWARETVAGQSTTAAYMTLANRGQGDDRLVSVAAAAPASASLHSTKNEGGISRMRSLESGLAIPAGATIDLKPGGTHVMLTGLKAPVRSGDVVKLTLRFEKSGERPVEFHVASAAGRGH